MRREIEIILTECNSKCKWCGNVLIEKQYCCDRAACIEEHSTYLRFLDYALKQYDLYILQTGELNSLVRYLDKRFMDFSKSAKERFPNR